MAEKRKDNKKRVLKEGEYQRANGSYEFRWRTEGGKRHYIYAATLEELREKEESIHRDKSEGIRTDAGNVTVNDIYALWCRLKKGLKDNTFQNYKYMYEQFVFPDFGKKKVGTLKRSDVRLFYNILADEKSLKVSSIDNVHTVLHQVLDIAVEDNYLRTNPSDNALKELKQSHNFDGERRMALTVPEQKLFSSYLEQTPQYHHWKPIFTVMMEAGLRVGEATGLRWEDVDIENGLIDINHTLVYYNHEKGGCYFGINSPKTASGRRMVPMTPAVKQALLEERQRQDSEGISCKVHVDGYTGFIFVNRFGNVQNQGTLNKALRRIMRDCNQEILEQAGKGKKKQSEMVLLPKFSCHSLRHTCATRLCEAGINMKVIQDFLGHADISTTMNIYTDATKDFKAREISRFSDFLAEKMTEAAEND